MRGRCRGDRKNPKLPTIDIRKSPFGFLNPTPSQAATKPSVPHAKETSSSDEDSTFDPTDAATEDKELEADDDIVPHEWEADDIIVPCAVTKNRRSCKHTSSVHEHKSSVQNPPLAKTPWPECAPRMTIHHQIIPSIGIVLQHKLSLKHTITFAWNRRS
jgi:hypothetical protein